MAGRDVTISGRWRDAAAPQLAMAAAAVLSAALLAPSSTESAVANGDTRTIALSNDHTNESGSFTYMVNGVYDSAVLDKLNWFCRDWRLNEPTQMDPHLFDIVWEVYRESGSTQPIDVLSGYRSPQTNAMLRRRSRQVAEHSAHMEGKAIDAHFVDVGTARIRDIAMRMQAGGVGFYPSGAQPWVHIDSGPIRYWPRMSRDALARLFPDGKTVFIPADGQPMPGYEQARAEIEARGGEIQTAGGGGLFAWLFGARGGGADDAEEEGGGEATGVARGGRGGGAGIQIADAGPDAIATAKRNLPTGPTYAGPVPSAKPRVLDAGPDAVAKAKRNLPLGPTYASAAEPAAPGQASGCRVAATGRPRERRRADPWAEGPRAAAAAAAERSRRRERRLAVPWAEGPRAAAAAAADRSRRRGRALRRSYASGAPGRSGPCVGARAQRGRGLAGAVEQRARPRRRGRATWLAAAGHHLRHRRRADRGSRPGGRLARAETQRRRAAGAGGRAHRAPAANADPQCPDRVRADAWQSRFRRPAAIGRDDGRGSRANVWRPAVVRRVQDDRSSLRRSAWPAVVNGCAQPLARGTRERTGAKRQVRAN